MSKYQSSLVEYVRRALLHDWDPIGVQSYSGASDEYDSYVPDVCELLVRKATLDEVLAYLWSLETQHMGLRGDRQRTETFANELINNGSKITA